MNNPEQSVNKIQAALKNKDCSNNNFFFKLNSQTCPLLSLECNLACGAGYVANATCNGCDISDICVADNPCLNNGMCTLNTPPSNYSCDCTGTNYGGANCESNKYNVLTMILIDLPISL